MSPVAVHLTEEAWHELGAKTSIHEEEWLKWDENLAKASSITLIVRFNGKLKDKIEADEALNEDELKALALESPKVKELTDGKDNCKNNCCSEKAGQYCCKINCQFKVIRITQSKNRCLV